VRLTPQRCIFDLLLLPVDWCLLVWSAALFPQASFFSSVLGRANLKSRRNDEDNNLKLNKIMCIVEESSRVVLKKYRVSQSSGAWMGEQVHYQVQYIGSSL
jgi:hypothetical protein